MKDIFMLYLHNIKSINGAVARAYDSQLLLLFISKFDNQYAGTGEVKYLLQL